MYEGRIWPTAGARCRQYYALLWVIELRCEALCRVSATERCRLRMLGYYWVPRQRGSH